MYNNIKKYWAGIIVAIIAIVFFIGTAGYNYVVQKDDFIKLGSPDETANYIFTKLYGQTKQMTIFEKNNLYVQDIILPRSFRSDSGYLKPVSFLGIILIYGKIVSLTSYKILPFLTPFFASIGVIFFYLLIKHFFGKKNALISCFLLACFPSFIYYSIRSMFHNVLFIALLIVGLYFITRTITNRKQILSNKCTQILYSALAGVFIGLAIITRSSELLWLAPVLIIIWLFNIRKFGITKLIIFLCFLFLAILPAMYWNQILYNSPINSGYPAMNQTIINIANASNDLMKTTVIGNFDNYKQFIKIIKSDIFYFGFHPDQSFNMLRHYFIKMFYWLFWPGIFGLFLFFQQIYKWKRKHWVYIISYFITFIVLLFYYGSWELYDNPDVNSFTIGNSYTRYWFPIYLGALPFVSLFIIRFTRALFNTNGYNANIVNNYQFTNCEYLDNFTTASKWDRKLRLITEYLKNIFKKHIQWPRKVFLINCARVLIIGIIYFISLTYVLYGSEEGLIYANNNYQQSKNEANKILSLTEKNSVIITRYHDKLLFPERMVVVGLFDDQNMNALYAKLTKHLPVYYYNFSLSKDAIKYLNNRRLKQVNLQIHKVQQITSDFTLYKLVHKVESP